MFTLIKSVSRFESRIDASIEKFYLSPQVFGGNHNLHRDASCHLGGRLCMYNHYCLANLFYVWLDMRQVCVSRKCCI